MQLAFEWEPEVQSSPGLREFVEQLATKGGYIVSTNVCGVVEIAFARVEGRMYVDANGLGYIRRPRNAKP